MIYVNGDSWTCGIPEKDSIKHPEFIWPYTLSKKLNEPVVIEARAGTSNHRIYRRTFDFLLTNKPKIAIVCLTRWERIELGNAETGKIHQYMPHRQPSYFKKDWHPYLAYTNFLRHIISLQNIAVQYNVNLYFLDTHNNNLERTPTITWFMDILRKSRAFAQMDDERIAQKFSKVEKLSTYINYDNFISNLSYIDLVNKFKMVDGHPDESGHTYMAELIYNYIQRK